MKDLQWTYLLDLEKSPDGDEAHLLLRSLITPGGVWVTRDEWYAQTPDDLLVAIVEAVGLVDAELGAVAEAWAPFD